MKDKDQPLLIQIAIKRAYYAINRQLRHGVGAAWDGITTAIAVMACHGAAKLLRQAGMTAVDAHNRALALFAVRHWELMEEAK